MARKHFRIVAPLLFWSALLASLPATAQATRSDAAGPQAQATTAQPPLRTRAALDAWLAAHAGQPTPLDLLPPLARARFIDSLVFGRGELGGFDTSDLATELTPAETGKVLALFDAEGMVGAVHSRNPDGPPSWRASPGEPGPAVLAFDTLYRMQRAAHDDPGRLRHRFASLSAAPTDPAGFNALPERELVYLLRSFSLPMFDTPDADDAERLRALVAAMERRGIARAPDLRLVYDRLLTARSFDAAQRYALAHPDAGLPPTPRFVDSTGSHPPALSVWRANADGTSLQRTAFDPGPVQILVTAGCHFSEDAARDISSDPVLGPVFARHASWLMLPPGKEDQEAVRDWNRRFPAAQASQVYDRSEWTLLPPGWRMPTFFVVRGGKVVGTVIGWKPADARGALIALLRENGLLPGEPATMPAPAAQGAASSSL